MFHENCARLHDTISQTPAEQIAGQVPPGRQCNASVRIQQQPKRYYAENRLAGSAAVTGRIIRWGFMCANAIANAMWHVWRGRARWLMQAEAQTERTASGALRKLRIFLDAIKFEHTIFALPFAYLGMALAARANHGWPGLDKLIWVTLAMAGARTVAMALNRLIDARMDARNPRTANRALPKKQLGPVRWWCSR